MTIDLRLGDCLEILPTLPDASVDACITDPPYELGFMGKKWDRSGVAFNPDTWRAVLRVLKPGAFLLCFGGTRTFHRLACAVEDAGFEIRDCMLWLYGSGFPKSHDISKAIDRAAGAERERVGTVRKSVSSMGPGEGNWSDDSYEWKAEYDITTPATDAAKLWDGWGTALKPAWEPIIVAMKPCDGTFAQNALKHGVAGLNIDGGRIGSGGQLKWERPRDMGYHGGSDAGSVEATESTKGRFPANLILDEEAATLLGFPSRFFYCAKASKAERGKANKHPTVKPLKLLEYLCTLTKTPTGGTVLDPFMGSGSTGLACKNTGRGFIGIELDPDYHATATVRINGLNSPEPDREAGEGEA